MRAMPKRQREDGLHALVIPDVSFGDWLNGMDESCFSTDTAFNKYVVQRRVLDGHGHLVPLPIRAVGIFLKYGVAMEIPKCTECGKKSRFEQRSSRGWTTYGWTCCSVGHKHMEIQLNKFGFLTEIPVNSWLPFLHVINLLRLGRNFRAIVQEIQAGYGNIKEHTIGKWRNVYQEALGAALDKMNARVVGGKNQTVVLDECVVGVHPEDGWATGSKGINKGGAAQNRTSERKNIDQLVADKVMKRLPGRTLHGVEKVSKTSPMLINKKPASRLMKKPSSVFKKPSGSLKKKPASTRAPAKRLKSKAANLKKNGAWLWLGVCVGNKKKNFTHDNKQKKVTYRLLPSSTKAMKNKPRGFEEIQDTVQSHVAKGSYLIFDGWTSTLKAVEALGYHHAPPVKHEKHFRDPQTGFHTNDAESENNRLKKWSRMRYNKLQLNTCEMDEYIFYINVGSSMSSVFHGLRMANGGPCKNKLLKLD